MDFLESAIKWRPTSQTLKFDLNLPWKVTDDDETSETLRCLWPFFRFFRIIGMCPVGRSGNKIVVHPKWHPTWYLTWLALTLISIMLFNAIFRAFPLGKGATELVSTANNFIYYAQVFFNCGYMIWRAKEIPRFINSCILVEGICQSYHEGERKTTGLMRDSYLLLIFFNSVQFTGNTIYYGSLVSTYNITSFSDFFDSFNEGFLLGEWGPYSGAGYVVSQFYCDLGWTFPDFLVGILALILGRLFSRLNKVIAQQKSIAVSKIEQLRSDHQNICELVHICNDIFSPLFFITYIANVGYLFTRLYTGLGTDLKTGGMLVQMETLYAFVFLIFIKILLPTYLAAKLNEKAHEGLDLIHSWESSVEVPDFKYKLLVVSRFVSQLSTAEIGISGCGYFTVTKGFLVTLISAFITYEVIILQFQAAELKAKQGA